MPALHPLTVRAARFIMAAFGVPEEDYSYMKLISLICTKI